MYRGDSMHPIFRVTGDLEATGVCSQHTLIAWARQNGEQTGSGFEIGDYIKYSQVFERGQLAGIDAAGRGSNGKQRAFNCVDQLRRAS
jgi:hypothetical protein